MLPIYQPHKDKNARLRSAKLAISSLLKLDLYPSHKRELLSVCIWKVTEADGKLNVRYWSQEAVKADKKDLRHEHVYERKELIDRLLNGEPLEQVFSDMVACIVTKDEHLALSKSNRSGWDRYKDTNIKVYDSQDGVWF